MYLGLNKGLSCVATYVDIRKAFDTVHHTLLLEKLNKLGLSNQALKLFKNYLSNRNQRGFCSDILSDKRELKVGATPR